jgi:hypothetical protein
MMNEPTERSYNSEKLTSVHKGVFVEAIEELASISSRYNRRLAVVVPPPLLPAAPVAEDLRAQSK